MTGIDSPIMTLPPRTLTAGRPEWHVGEAVTVDRVRWIIRAINHKTGKVVLASSNTVNADIWWNTTLDNIPEKTR